VLKPKFWCLRVEVEEKKYLVVDGDKHVIAYNTKKEAAGYFERSYELAHRRSYEASMSACFHFIQYNPRVVGPLTLEEVKKAAGDDPEVFSMWGGAGGIDGLLLKNELPCKDYPVNIAAGLKKPAGGARIYP